MKVSFLGHQTWFVQNKETNILVDPLLMTIFGASEKSFGAIYPFREICIAQIPRVDAIFLSHEHADHFCIDTLHALDKRIPIYVGPLMMRNVIDTCLALGFEVRTVFPEVSLEIGQIKITAFHAGRETPYWENRVYQFYFESLPNYEESFYLAVDAGMSSTFVEALQRNKVPSPDLIALSNNAQITDYGRRSAFENARIDEKLNPQKNGFPGLRVYQSLVVNYLEDLPDVKNVVICGGGFLKGKDDLNPQPYSDHRDITNRIDQAANVGAIHALQPGGSLQVSSNGVKPGEACRFVTLRSLDWFRRTYGLSPNSTVEQNTEGKLFRPYLKESGELNMTDSDRELLKTTMEDILVCLQVSSVGRSIFFESVSLGNLPTVAFQLVDRKGDSLLIYSLNLLTSSVNLVSLEQESAHSIRLFAEDFLAVLNGDIEIWDLSGTSIEARYQGRPIDSFVPFLYAYFGEHVRQDLARKMMNKKLQEIQI